MTCLVIRLFQPLPTLVTHQTLLFPTFPIFSISREPRPPYSGLGVLVIECDPLCLVVSCREVWGAWWYEKGAGWRAGCLTCKWEANLRRREEGAWFTRNRKIEKLEIAVFDGCPKSEEVENVDLPCKSKANLRRRKEGRRAKFPGSRKRRKS